MKGSIVKKGRLCDVTVTKTHLKCTLKNSLGPNAFLEIPLSDILAVETPSREGSAAQLAATATDASSSNDATATATTTTATISTGTSAAAATSSSSAASASSSSAAASVADNNNQSAVVHYVGRRKDRRSLTWEKLVLSGDPGLCSELNNICNSNFAGRQKPRQFFVLINPNSGRKTAGRVFHKKVAPLFRACGVNFRVYETNGPRDARNGFRDLDFSTLDGIIVVGGDGFYSEVLTGMVLRQQQLAGLNADDPDVEVSQLPVPVGVVPGGSGNYVAHYLYGAKDPVTAAIHILMGKTMPSNVVGVYQGGRLEGCAGLICSFGLFGDVMHECERFRWMGNFRYKVIPIRTILGRRTFPGRVEYLHAQSGEWQEVKGQFYGIDINVVDLVDNGEALVPTFGPEANTVHITSECSLGDHIKGLKKVEEWATGAYDYPFIKNEPVHRLRVSLDSGAETPRQGAGAETEDKALDGVTYYINLDGEALPVTRTKFQMKVHLNLVKLFGERHPPR